MGLQSLTNTKANTETKYLKYPTAGSARVSNMTRPEGVRQSFEKLTLSNSNLFLKKTEIEFNQKKH